MDNRDVHIVEAFSWLTRENGENFLSSEEHCPTRDIFQARLERMSNEMERHGGFPEIFPLITAILGEIGNNAFDHNLGNWRDERGIYFFYDLQQKFAVIADRGMGVLSTLKVVKSELVTENEALRIAFTQIISGRAPEKRGNGLKFVESVVRDHDLSLFFYSGDGEYILNHGHEDFESTHDVLFGVLVLLVF